MTDWALSGWTLRIVVVTTYSNNYFAERLQLYMHAGRISRSLAHAVTWVWVTPNDKYDIIQRKRNDPRNDNYNDG